MSSQSWIPDFVDQLPKIKFYDPLGALLTGSSKDTYEEYGFRDVVKMSGHICPTVAGAYAMVLETMKRLYPEGKIPVRGEISVLAPATAETGAMGPFTQIITYLTGACADNGFHGLGGKFVRRGLLLFTASGGMGDPFYFTRLDTNQRVGVIYNSSKIPPNPKVGELMEKNVLGMATEEEKKEFGQAWLTRVRFILEEQANRDLLFEFID